MDLLFEPGRASSGEKRGGFFVVVAVFARTGSEGGALSRWHVAFVWWLGVMLGHYRCYCTVGIREVARVTNGARTPGR